MRLSFRRLRPLDIVVVLVSLAALVYISMQVYKGNSERPMVYITDDKGEWVQPLDKDGDIEAKGPLGSTWVHIEGGRVHIASSPCPNQTCVTAGDIFVPGQWLACLPNRVFIRIEGKGEKLDAFVQ